MGHSKEILSRQGIHTGVEPKRHIWVEPEIGNQQFTDFRGGWEGAVWK